MKPWNRHWASNNLSFTLSPVRSGGELKTLDDLLDRAENHAFSSLHESGELLATFFVLGIDGPEMLTAASLDNDAAKDDFAEAAHLLTIAHAARASVVALESWATFAKPGQAIDSTKAPSESKDRQELIMLMGEEPDKLKQRMLPILRNEAGKFAGFGQSLLSHIQTVQGRFTHLLNTKMTSEQERNVAETILRSKGVVLSPDLRTNRSSRYRM